MPPLDGAEATCIGAEARGAGGAAEALASGESDSGALAGCALRCGRGARSTGAGGGAAARGAGVASTGAGGGGKVCCCCWAGNGGAAWGGGAGSEATCLGATLEADDASG